jgi:putative transposase
VNCAFIDAEQAVYPIRRLCAALAVSASGYDAWRDRPPSTHAVVDHRLRGALRLAHAESHGRYGSPRLHQQLRQAGVSVSRKRVVRLDARRRLAGASPATISRYDRQCTSADGCVQSSASAIYGRRP